MTTGRDGDDLHLDVRANEPAQPGIYIRSNLISSESLIASPSRPRLDY